MREYWICLVLAVMTVVIDAAPKSRNKGPQMVLDQKQKGDFNLQLHLKDFQFIALLGDDALGGDYDYNYDYADFTVKPSSIAAQESSATTLKPTEAAQTATNSYEQPSTSTSLPLKDEEITPSNTGKPIGLLGESKPEDEDKPLDNAAANSSSTETSAAANLDKNDEKLKPPPISDAIPGQIQVQILETPEGYPNFTVRKDSVLENHDSSQKAEDEKKCTSGFFRDKKGKCRRVRRPVTGALPFNFGRLANLAAKFRSSERSEVTTKVPTSSSEKPLKNAQESQ